VGFAPNVLNQKCGSKRRIFIRSFIHHVGFVQYHSRIHLQSVMVNGAFLGPSNLR
jgi:hypothetical protein